MDETNQVKQAEVNFLIPKNFIGKQKKYLIHYINLYPDEMAAMKEANISYSTLKYWKSNDTDFIDFIIDIKEMLAHKLMRKYIELAFSGDQKSLQKNLEALKPELYDKKNSKQEIGDNDDTIKDMLKAIREENQEAGNGFK